MNIPSPRKWVTADVVAAFLSVSVGWVYHHTRRGASDPLPYKRVGRWLRFDLEDVRTWIETRTERERIEREAEMAEWNRPNSPPVTSSTTGTSPLPFRVAPKRRAPCQN